MSSCDDPVVVDDRTAARETKLVTDILLEEKSRDPWPVLLCRVNTINDLLNRSGSSTACCERAFDIVGERLKLGSFERYSSL